MLWLQYLIYIVISWCCLSGSDKSTSDKSARCTSFPAKPSFFSSLEVQRERQRVLLSTGNIFTCSLKALSRVILYNKKHLSYTASISVRSTFVLSCVSQQREKHFTRCV
uniref:Putative secreted protein n=1 Tax=Rhipicephalus microplus TaxID=6941 RepID=A0A6G5A0N8_RHIMP